MLSKLVKFKKLKKHFSANNAFLLSLSLIFQKQNLRLYSGKFDVELRKNTKDLETFEEIFFTNLYDVSLPFAPKTIVDAGANIGLASVFFHLKYPKAEIVAIEIEKHNMAQIKRNTKSIENFELLQKGLFNRKAFFKVEDPYNATNSFQIREVPSSEPFDIESITLDEIINLKNWQTIDILKIDIEGAEKELFESNYENWLPKTKVIFIETHDRMRPKCSHTVTTTINKYNFMLYTTTEGTLIYFNQDLINI